MSSSDSRLDQLRHWLIDEQRWPLARLAPASADASFRRYFRVWSGDGATRVVMDAPPDKEDVAPYLKVSVLLERCGVHVPRIDASDVKQGFVLLEDLGSVPYLSRLQDPANAEALYGDALSALLRIQLRGRALCAQLPAYDGPVLAREMALMPEWFCTRHLGVEPSARERALIDATFDFLIAEASMQPTVFVHRDYHSRNLMVLERAIPASSISRTRWPAPAAMTWSRC